MVVDIRYGEVLPRLARDAAIYIPDHQKAVGRHHMKREGQHGLLNVVVARGCLGRHVFNGPTLNAYGVNQKSVKPTDTSSR